MVTPEDADNKAITWESDNEDVATVDDDGMVTALSRGTANITVTTDDGSFTDTIKITVTKPYTPSAPTIKKYEVSFQVADGTPAGISSRNGVSNDFSGFKIEIFTDAERNTKKTETETDNEGKASVKLPNGEYWFRVSKEGYADYPSESPVNPVDILSIQRTSIDEPGVRGYFEVNGTDVDVTNDSPIFMIHVYNVSFKVNDETDNSPIQDAQISVFSDIDRNNPVGSTQTTGENGEATLDVDLTSGITYYYTVTANGYQDNQSSFTPDTEPVEISMAYASPKYYYGGVSNSLSSTGDYNNSEISVPLPSTSAGDLIIVIFATNEDMGNIPTEVDGFQQIVSKVGNGYPSIAAFYKIVSSTENSNFICKLENENHWFAHSFNITGHRNTSPIGNHSSRTISDSTTINIPGINSASYSLLIAAAAAQAHNDVLFDNNPTMMDQLYNVTINTMKLSLKIAIEDRSTAGDTDIRNFSIDDDDSDTTGITGIMFEILSPNSVY
ncbi:MAG: Ig-like domain-containing protein [bacterium]